MATELAATMPGVLDGHAAPERVPTIVNLAGVTDAGELSKRSADRLLHRLVVPMHDKHLSTAGRAWLRP
jgi:hypothetical protein